MTVQLSSSSVGNIGEEQCLVSEIYKKMIYMCVENETALPPWLAPSDNPSNLFCILSKDQRKHSWIMKAVSLSYETHH